MPKQRKQKDEPATTCEPCSGRKGRNRLIHHQLRFESADAFRTHLLLVLPKHDLDSGWLDSRVVWYRFVHKHYGNVAFEKFQPVWLTYLEGNGVVVHNPDKAVQDYRAAKAQTEVPF